jgi:hypothetical protein
MPELESTPHSFLTVSVHDQPDARSRRLGLLVLIGACVTVYASVMFGVARAWAWVSTHLSSVASFVRRAVGNRGSGRIGDTGADAGPRDESA